MPPFALAQGKENEDTVIKLILEGSLKMAANQRILPTDWNYSGNDKAYSHFLMYLHHLSKKSSTSQRDYEEICQVFKKAAHFLEDKEGLIARRAGQLFKARGDYIEAIPLYELFLRKQKQLEPQDPVTLAQALYDVGCIRAFQALNRKNGSRNELLEKSTTMLFHALKLQEANLGRGHIDLTRTRLTLAELRVELSDYPSAEALANFALSEQLSEVPEDHYEIAETLLTFGAMHPGAFEECKIRKGYVERAVAIVDKWNRCDATQADAYSMMEGCLTYSDLDKRIELQRRTLEIREKNTPHERHTIYSDHQHLAWLSNRNHDYQLEVAELTTAIEVLMEMLPPDHPRILCHLKELEAAKLRAGSEAN